MVTQHTHNYRYEICRELLQFCGEKKWKEQKGKIKFVIHENDGSRVVVVIVAAAGGKGDVSEKEHRRKTKKKDTDVECVPWNCFI